MTVLIVDLLEVIDIQHHQGVWQTGALSVGYGQIELLIHGSSVFYTGQRINSRQMFQTMALAVVTLRKYIGRRANHNSGCRKGQHLNIRVESTILQHGGAYRGEVEKPGDTRTGQKKSCYQAGIQPEQSYFAYNR